MASAPQSRRDPHPMSAWTYLARNPRRVLPVFSIQMLVTALMVAIVTVTNVFEATSETYLRPLDVFTIVAPRRTSTFDDELLGLLDANPAQDKRLTAKMLWMSTPMIVGEGRAPLIALSSESQDEFIERVGSRLVAGDLPEPGSDGAVVHEAILRARGMTIGDSFGQNVDPEHAILDKFTVVGVLDGLARVGVVDFEYASRQRSVLARMPPFQMVYGASGRKAESDRYLREAINAEGLAAFRVIDASFMRERVSRSMKNLPLVIGFITGSIAIVVAFVTALLNLIAFQVRSDELGLFLAIGHQRGRLVRKLAFESGLVAFSGWLVGIGLGLLAVWLFKVFALEPKGILIWVVDLRPIAYSVAVPVLSALVSALLLGRRLRRMDPVTIIQRRGA